MIEDAFMAVALFALALGGVITVALWIKDKWENWK